METKGEVERVVDDARTINQVVARGSYGPEAARLWALLRTGINDLAKGVWGATTGSLSTRTYFAEQARPTQSGDADNRLDVTEPTDVRSITPVSIPRRAAHRLREPGFAP